MRESNNCELRVCIEHAIIRTQYFFFFLSFFLYCFTVTRSKKKYRRKKNRKLKTEGQSAIQTDSLSTIKNKLIRNGVHEVIENT